MGLPAWQRAVNAGQRVELFRVDKARKQSSGYLSRYTKPPIPVGVFMPKVST